MKRIEELLKKAEYLNEEGEYQKVIELLSDDKLETFNSADLYTEKAFAFFRLKEFEFSNEAAERAIAINPKHAKSILNKGNSYFELKEYDKAIECYIKATEIDPKYVYAYYGLGRTYRALKEHDKAIKCHIKAIEIDPKYAYPYNGLGSIYTELKEHDKAVEFYNKAIELDPKFMYSFYNLGINYSELKEFDKSIECYKKAIELDPQYVNSYYGLGFTYSEHKEYDKALTYYEKYVELTKNIPDYYTSVAKSRITELKKVKDSTEFSHIRELVNKIKDLLLFEKGCITHYTSLSVAKALILDGSDFRLSEGAFLNDTSEGRELFKFLYFHSPSKKVDDTVAELFTQKPFIGSFVAEIKHDDLTLWRMYGKEDKVEAKGCAITIDMKKLQENLKDKMIIEKKTSLSSKTDEEFSFYRVAYREHGEQDKFIVPGANEKEKVLNKYMNDLSTKVKRFSSKKKKKTSDTQNLVELLNEIAYLIKSTEYQHENELRLVVKGIGFKKNIDSISNPPRVYIELVTVRSLIEKITLGPKVERADEWAAAFYYSLNNEDYQPDIHISQLPYK